MFATCLQPDSFANAAGHSRAVSQCVYTNTLGSRRRMKENGKRKKELKIKEGKKISVFTFASPLFFHLIQLPATRTTPALHGKVAERVCGGCSRDTVYIFAHNPSQSSKGMVRIILFISKDNTIALYYTRRTFKR